MSDAGMPLGRRPPSDDKHIRLYRLTPATMPTTPTPVVIGISWYDSFYSRSLVYRDRAWWVDRVAGPIAGGHALCLRPPTSDDTKGWYRFYDQNDPPPPGIGDNSACVGFAFGRSVSHMDRVRVSGWEIYRWAKDHDEWDGNAYEGTSVRAGADCLRLVGAYRVRAGQAAAAPTLELGILENRWATSIDEVAACLAGNDPAGTAAILNRGWVEWLNSWGWGGYAHLVRVPLDILHRLLFLEDGDATVVTARPGPARAVAP
jgi:hypothetical protein